MSTELNDKIQAAIKEFSYCKEGGDVLYCSKAANAIESLVLKSQIDLLRPLLADKFVYESIENKISELSKQLKELKPD